MIFFGIQGINHFQTFIDENGLESFIHHISGDEAKFRLGEYIRSQYFLFSVGTVITSIIFAFRMVNSIWRYHNKGTI
jgi:hypothetical protein